MYKQLSILLLSSTITGITWMGYHSNYPLSFNAKTYRVSSRAVPGNQPIHPGYSTSQSTEQPGLMIADTGILPLTTAVLLVQDPDWQFITVQKMLALDRFVKSDIALQDFDFSNADEVAPVLERTAEQVQGTAILLEQAKERLRQRYNLPLPQECEEERLTPEERNAENRNIVAYFRNERVAFQKLKSFLLKDRLLLGQKQCHMQFEYSWWAQSGDYCYWGGALNICS